MFLNICEESNILSVILYLKYLINILQFIIPIALIIMCAIDLGKVMLNPEDKKQPKILKRMIAAVLIFFIPTILNIVLDAAGQQSYTATDCWTNANTTTIAVLRANEEKEKEEARKARQKENAEAKKLLEETQKAREEASKENASSTTLLKENGTDGKVDVIDGVFYKPSSRTSGSAGTKGSGPYGYNIYFYNRLQALIDDAAKLGYTVKYSTSVDGAWRSYERQDYFYQCYINQNCNNGNLAAKPGNSNHGWGIASDLSFGSTNAMYWAHDHAAEYGLRFSECKNVRDRNNCVENWHIQALDIRKK